jgi:hypothetical protein
LCADIFQTLETRPIIRPRRFQTLEIRRIFFPSSGSLPSNNLKKRLRRSGFRLALTAEASRVTKRLMKLKELAKGYQSYLLTLRIRFSDFFPCAEFYAGTFPHSIKKVKR